MWAAGVLTTLLFFARGETTPLLAVVGDTQVTTFPERWIGRELNSDVTPRILDWIAKENPSVFLHLGDAVTCGGCPSWILSGWEFFRSASAPIRNLGIPRYLATGNHEYWGSEATMRAGIRANFPDTPELPAALRFGALAIAILDSNRPGPQRGWLEKVLSDWDRDPTVRWTAIATHHPPFSNSKVVGGHRSSRTVFLPAFQSAKKTRLWLSGHAHGYEHIFKEGRHFVISAGGGGARQPLAESREHRDLYEGAFPRPFNYLLLRQVKNALVIDAQGWDRSWPKPRAIDRIKLN